MTATTTNHQTSNISQYAKHGIGIPDLVVHTLTVPTNISAGIVVMIPEYWTRHTRVSSVPISQVQEGREYSLRYHHRTPCSYYLTINPRLMIVIISMIVNVRHVIKLEVIMLYC